MKSALYDQMVESVQYVNDEGYLPFIPVIETAHNAEVFVKNRKYLLFSSNSYLGLNVHPTVVAAAKKAIDDYGTGGGNARILSGTLKIHIELEKTIAWFKKTDAALAFPAGFMVNVGLVPALTKVFSLNQNRIHTSNDDVVIFSDELNHASIIEGCKLSGSKVVKYSHCNIDDLKQKVNAYPKSINKLFVTDGVFSLDGDIAPVDRIVELARDNNAMVMVDDAHGTGILGKTGRGIVEYFNVHDGVDVMMGTFSKALGTAGGFIAGNQSLIDYLRIATRSYLFTASIAPPVCGTVISALHVIDEHPELIKLVMKNATRIRSEFSALGFDVMNTVTPVIPMVIGDERKTMEVSKELFAQGVIAPAVRYPAVPMGKARIRFTASALHTDEHIDRLLEIVSAVGKKLKII